MSGYLNDSHLCIDWSIVWHRLLTIFVAIWFERFVDGVVVLFSQTPSLFTSQKFDFFFLYQMGQFIYDNCCWFLLMFILIPLFTIYFLHENVNWHVDYSYLIILRKKISIHVDHYRIMCEWIITWFSHYFFYYKTERMRRTLAVMWWKNPMKSFSRVSAKNTIFAFWTLGSANILK